MDAQVHRPRRRVPRVAAALVALIVLIPVASVLLAALPGEREIWPVWFFAPPMLGVLGGAAALLDRSVLLAARVGWAVGAGVVGFITPTASWMIFVLLFGP